MFPFNRIQIQIYATVLFLSLFCTVLGCRSLFEYEENKVPVVLLAPHDTAIRCNVLVDKVLNIKTSVLPKGPLPYSQNANATLWIGTEFDYKKAIEVIKYCANYYPYIRYIGLSDLGVAGKNRGRYELFLGAPTDRALCLGLKPWTVREKRRLLFSRSKEEFHKRIRSKTGAKKHCLPPRSAESWF